jgi:glycosyltransferase involved in cell wall biosynthesis
VNRLQLLFLTPQLPHPPHQGTTIRNYNIIADLAQRHEIDLLSFVAPEQDAHDLGPLAQLCRSVHTVSQPNRTRFQRIQTTLTSPRPDMAHRLASPAFQGMLEQAMATHHYDVVEFEGIEMIPFLPPLLNRTAIPSPRPRLVFDDHNAEYLLQKRFCMMDAAVPRRWPGALYSFIQWQKLRHYEAWACRHVHSVAAVSEGDADALRRIVPGLQVTVVPNGVSIRDYSRAYVSSDLLSAVSLVFSGKMDFRANVDGVLWFVHSVLPLVLQRVPEARFYAVGQRPHSRLEPLLGQPGVVVTGHVPDIRPYIAEATVYVVPLRSGGGTRLKVLEAMAMRRPIVSTSMGCDGFPVTSGREVILADSAEEFARHVVDLLHDGAQRDALGENAFQFASTRYDWAAIVPRLEATYTA